MFICMQSAIFVFGIGQSCNNIIKYFRKHRACLFIIILLSLSNFEENIVVFFKQFISKYIIQLTELVL